MSVKKAGKSSLAAAFGAFAAEAGEELQNRQSQPVEQAPRVVAPVVTAAKRSIATLREERDRLAVIASHGGYQEIDPELIDPSPFSDRLPDDNEDDFDQFKQSIREKGQKVPVLVRLHPEVAGRYQVIYGHRRTRAARELGIKVKALVSEYSDADLAIAQGIENAERQDLTWIEKALFANRMAIFGLQAKDILDALSIDKGEASRFRRVVGSVPEEIVRRIGRAPKAGRTRWLLLAEAIETDPGALQRVAKAVAGGNLLASDERFEAALSAALRTEKAPRAVKETLSLEGRGSVVGKAVFAENAVQLRLAPEHAPAFTAFLKSELPALMERFAARATAAE